MQNKVICMGLFLLLGFNSLAWGRLPRVSLPKVKVPSYKSLTRIKGADISRYSAASQLWAQTYRLNQNFLNSLQPVRITGISVHPKLPARIEAHFKGISLESAEIISKHFDDKLAWIQGQPQLGKDLLREIDGLEVDFRFYQQLSESNLVFVGEVHGNLAPRIEFANLVKGFKKIYPNRKIVVFAEAAYLKPIEGESIFPYQYYRRGAEGVEPAIDFSEKSNPNARLVDDETLQFKEMFSSLSDAGVEIYPVEDAVVAQKESAQGAISTVDGLAERNRGFARVMQAQMEKIRLEDPETLFVYYGGMAHTSWAMPVSLPKLFANEKSLVVELVVEKDAETTFSLLPVAWGQGHPAFSKMGNKRLFLWDGAREQTANWGKVSGFDCRIIIP